MDQIFEIVLKATEQPKILKFTPIKKINLDLAKSDLEARNFQIRMLYADRTGYINQSDYRKAFIHILDQYDRVF